MGKELVLRNSGNLPVLAENNSLVAYLEEIKKFPLLSETEEQELVKKFHGEGDR